jgi:hypothetical protein
MATTVTRSYTITTIFTTTASTQTITTTTRPICTTTTTITTITATRPTRTVVSTTTLIRPTGTITYTAYIPVRSTITLYPYEHRTRTETCYITVTEYEDCYSYRVRN